MTFLTFYQFQFLPENFTVILFHYDGNVKEWWDLEWSNEAIHIVARNQTKWYVSSCIHDSLLFSGSRLGEEWH